MTTLEVFGGIVAPAVLIGAICFTILMTLDLIRMLWRHLVRTINARREQ